MRKEKEKQIHKTKKRPVMVAQKEENYKQRKMKVGKNTKITYLIVLTLSVLMDCFSVSPWRHRTLYKYIEKS